MAKLLKRKVIFVQLGAKRYRCTEMIEELTNHEAAPVIDLTGSDEQPTTTTQEKTSSTPTHPIIDLTENEEGESTPVEFMSTPLHRSPNHFLSPYYSPTSSPVDFTYAQSPSAYSPTSPAYDKTQ